LVKRIDQKEDIFKPSLDLEKLENEAKANSRLRYHRNKKPKVLNALDLYKDFSSIFS
jgi:hypothetical protein